VKSGGRTFCVGNAVSMISRGAAVKLKAIPNPIKHLAPMNIPA
jgi:hypothetical protein